MRWLFSNNSSTSIMSREILEESGILNAYPFKLTYFNLNERDNVKIVSPYTGEKMWSSADKTVLGRVQVPLHLGNGFSAIFEIFVVESCAVDVLLGMDFVRHFQLRTIGANRFEPAYDPETLPPRQQRYAFI